MRPRYQLGTKAIESMCEGGVGHLVRPEGPQGCRCGEATLAKNAADDTNATENDPSLLSLPPTRPQISSR